MCRALPKASRPADLQISSGQHQQPLPALGPTSTQIRCFSASIAQSRTPLRHWRDLTRITDAAARICRFVDSVHRTLRERHRFIDVAVKNCVRDDTDIARTRGAWRGNPWLSIREARGGTGSREYEMSATWKKDYPDDLDLQKSLRPSPAGLGDEVAPQGRCVVRCRINF
jgi:hypothetical protein